MHEQEKLNRLDAAIQANKGQKGAVMVTLQEAQEIFGYVPKDIQIRIAEGLGVTLSEVYGVATFYAQFALQPRGEHVIGVCLGTACYVKGSKNILEKLIARARRARRLYHAGREVHAQGYALPGRVRPCAGYDD